MKILIGLCLILSACSATPKKPSSDTITQSFECYASDNVQFKNLVLKNESLNNYLIQCKTQTIKVDMYVNHGPDEVLILDQTTGKWFPYLISDCGIIHE